VKRQRPPRRSPPRQGPPARGRSAAAVRPKRRLTGWRRWVFPPVTALVVPALLFGMLEGGLRLFGYGAPSAFLLAIDDDTLVTNPRFGWRFFPPAIARAPVVERLAVEKPAGTVRIVVLGGSAAMGTPEADFGVGRVLEAMLAESFPERRFEVVNAAMAAIDSHVVRVIGRELAGHRPDAFLLYLGNNEVVGPHGPGTVFGGYSSSLPALRARIWLQGTRTGQLLRDVAGSLAGGQGRGELGRWRGMEMFLERQVPADDPRLEGVHGHFAANLDDLVDAARAAGARTYLSTVAVNLVDEPPFASVHRADLPAAEAARFARLADEGWTLLAGGAASDALPRLAQAVAIDEGHAAGRWLLGRALLALGRRAEAAEHLAAARDLDALRFRADSGVERAIRRVARGRAADGVVLVEGAARVAGVEPGEPPLAGHDVLWEHVHLTAEGNHRLARAFFDALDPWLAGAAAPQPPGTEPLAPEPPAPQPPGSDRVARWLALSAWDHHHMARQILGMVRRPPFVGQLGHPERIAAFERSRARLAVAAWRGRDEAEALDRAVLAARPDDLHVREQLARLLDERDRPAEAAEQWRELLRRVPGLDAWRTRLAFSLADAGQTGEARRILEAVLAERGDADSLVNLGQVLERAGDPAAAAEHYRAALASEPAHEPARLALAILRGRQGAEDEAERLVRAGLELDEGSPRAWAALAALLERRGDLAAAVDAWQTAVELDPDDAAAANNLGFALERLGRPEEASERYLRAVAVDPTYALPYFNLADLALERGHAEEAIRFYRAGLELAPGNRQARQNLAVAEAARTPPV
jgi:tetratricopeptide (TPR) repeat protein